MSKKRLYEIAKEVGVESKVIVAKAQELGLSVKSHSSSVEEADANRITSSLKAGTAKDESKPAPKATPTPKEEKVEPKVDKASVAKSAPAKETSKAEVKEASVALKKPKSRNFKAEREARAKAEAERRKTVGDEITVTEINKETIKVSVTIMIVAIKKEMVKGTITKEIAITVLIMTVISKGNCVMIRIKITVEIMLEIIRQVRALT